jgi:hypothetical protein
VEALVIGAESMAYLKVDPRTFDRQHLESYRFS